MFGQNRHQTNSASGAGGASSSHHNQSGGPGGPSSGANVKMAPGGGVVKELLDRLQEEYNHLQQQLHNARVELEKGQQERESLQRYAMVYNETMFSLNMEMQKNTEIAKRLSGILTHVIPLLPQEHQGSAITAVERAKTISPQELQGLLNTHMQQQHLAAMMQAMGPAAAAAFNPAMMMAGMGLNMNIKPEEAMQAMFNNILKNPMLGAAAAGLPPPGVALTMGGAGAPLGPGPSSSSVPPNEESGRPSTQPGGRASSVLNSGASAASQSRPRSDTPSAAGTPGAKRAKLEPEEGDGELEIDVQNDDATSSAAPSHHTNGRTSQPPSAKGGHGGAGKDTERDTASASSSRSRDSATPRSGKQQLSSTPGSSTGAAPPMAGLLPGADPSLANFFTAFSGGRFPANLNPGQMGGLFGLPPAAPPVPHLPGAMGAIPAPLGALAAAAATNGKSPAYAFKISVGEPMTAVDFPKDAMIGPDIPKSMKNIADLPHGEVVCAVTMAKDGRRVFTGGRGVVKVWDIADRVAAMALNSGESPTGGRDSADGSRTNGENNRAASVEPLAPIGTFPCLDSSYIRSCKLFPDSSTLIVGGETKNICIVDVERGDIKQTWDCDSEACYALALSADCRLCFSCCSNGTIVVWDLASGERVAQMEGHSDGASCVDLSGDGTKLWTGGLDSTVRCWDIGERQEVDKLTLESQIFSLGCCPTDDWVAVGMEDQNVQVLNTARSGDKYLLTGHQSCVLSLKFAHNGKWFVSTGKDNVVNSWRTPYGFKLVKTKENSSVLSCDISADDRFLLTGSGDKKATLYELGF